MNHELYTNGIQIKYNETHTIGKRSGISCMQMIAILWKIQ